MTPSGQLQQVQVIGGLGGGQFFGGMQTPFNLSFQNNGAISPSSSSIMASSFGGTPTTTTSTTATTPMASNANTVASMVASLTSPLPPTSSSSASSTTPLQLKTENGDIKKEVQVRLTFHVKLKNWYLEWYQAETLGVIHKWRHAIWTIFDPLPPIVTLFITNALILPSNPYPSHPQTP